MNRDYEIRLCREDEYDKLVCFIKENWNENHIFVKSKTMLDFQHLDKKNKIYNFVIAYNRLTKEFDAILGFIPLKHYDNKLDSKDYWITMWKAKPSLKNGIGLGLFNFFLVNQNPETFSGIGLSKIATKIWKALGYYLCELRHFYIPNDKLNSFNIAIFSHLNRNNFVGKKTNYILKAMDQNMLINFCNFQNQNPKKSIDFIVNRYIKHPFYDYKLYGFYDGSFCAGMFVCRVIKIANSQCIRIVDWLGEFVQDSYNLFQELLEENKAEYIDLLCYMNNYEKIIKMGFISKVDNDIIPNYFEPFEKSNITLMAFTNNLDYVMFKGDSDQDRPNILL
ncbi:hypothetical protein [Campylobacter taeniopygiae]|uniref:N-acetyltransferase domain-containing protein n=1 Tax=Campylobacter taeniopygiae TaxID=2510188 RepID=A0ABY2TJF5_9BACT|nr:hypothetical protein [Campylobacter taeniopygiae]TKX34101.1 hypothetical protein CQA75_04175 [Campylobacter taeniopygiae]